MGAQSFQTPALCVGHVIVEKGIDNIIKKEYGQIIFLLIAVGLAYGVGCMGRSRKIGFWLAFFISLLNVIVGLIVVLCSKKLDNVESYN